ncbi:MAG: peptidase [Ramlibacter sp.]|nr:peptidase [Ramlibacter sp.]
MSASTTAPFGTWKSPLGGQRVAAGVKPLSAPRISGDSIFWLEGQPAEAGRVAAIRKTASGAPEVITPAPFNVRSRVHEYGGGAYAVDGNTVYFSNFADNLVYAQEPGGLPRALTGNSSHRHADFEFDAARHRLVAVREDYSVAGHEPATAVVSLPLDPAQPSTVLVSGFDFFAAPRLSPDGKQLAWLCWNHPLMPWNGTELWLGDVAADGALTNTRKIAGKSSESLCQPVWSPAGELFVVSDRTGWWNLYRLRDGALAAVTTMQAEFGQPLWVFGQSLYGFTGEQEIVAVCIEGAVSRLVRIDLSSGLLTTLASPFTDVRELRAAKGFVVVHAAAAHLPDQIVRIDVASGRQEVLAQATHEVPPSQYLSAPQSISFPSANGRVSYGFFYPPANGDYQAPAGELPPLIVTSHGGPTSMSTGSLRLAIQFWTSRGFAVLDVNYGGSTGYGRAYMDSLKGQWGIVDVEDCVAGAQYVAQRGLVDGQRMAIRGGSASGFTTLCALTFHRVFKAGASHFGVSDLAALDADTHKFESRYTSYLVAPPPQRDALYRERSPILHTDKLSCPMIFFQGLDDKVVPPAQSESMVAALRAHGIPVAYVPFEGEGHGFRRLENIQRSLEAELLFYATVFGFEQADKVEPIEISPPISRP